jgi:hypothetical protein
MIILQWFDDNSSMVWWSDIDDWDKSKNKKRETSENSRNIKYWILHEFTMISPWKQTWKLTGAVLKTWQSLGFHHDQPNGPVSSSRGSAPGGCSHLFHKCTGDDVPWRFLKGHFIGSKFPDSQFKSFEHIWKIIKVWWFDQWVNRKAPSNPRFQTDMVKMLM